MGQSESSQDQHQDHGGVGEKDIEVNTIQDAQVAAGSSSRRRKKRSINEWQMSELIENRAIMERRELQSLFHKAWGCLVLGLIGEVLNSICSRYFYDDLVWVKLPVEWISFFLMNFGFLLATTVSPHKFDLDTEGKQEGYTFNYTRFIIILASLVLSVFAATLFPHLFVINVFISFFFICKESEQSSEETMVSNVTNTNLDTNTTQNANTNATFNGSAKQISRKLSMDRSESMSLTKSQFCTIVTDPMTILHHLLSGNWREDYHSIISAIIDICRMRYLTHKICFYFLIYGIVLCFTFFAFAVMSNHGVDEKVYLISLPFPVAAKFTPIYIVCGIICVFGCFVMVLFLGIWGSVGYNRTKLAYLCVYIWQLVFGSTALTGGILVAIISRDHIYLGLQLIGSSIMFLFPTFLVLYYGSEEIFIRAARGFERYASFRDGALIAHSMSQDYEVGDEYYIYDEKNVCDDKKNKKECFIKGNIVQMTDYCDDKMIKVKIMRGDREDFEDKQIPSSNNYATLYLDAIYQLRYIEYGEIIQSRKLFEYSPRALGENEKKLLADLYDKTQIPSSLNVSSPRKTLNTPKETLDNDMDKIRALDNDMDKIRALDEYARSIQKIDYFISHAWRDGENKDLLEEKVKIITEIGEKYAKEGKRASFWLDKACLDQKEEDNMKIGLKSLPLNVRACRKMLILCGPNYMKRLWCVWELLQILMFNSRVADAEAELTQVFRRIDFHFLDEESETNFIKDTEKFELRNAECFDPNEKRNILRAIDKVMGGKNKRSRFERKLTQIFKKFRDYLVKQKTVIARHSSIASFASFSDLVLTPRNSGSSKSKRDSDGFWSIQSSSSRSRLDSDV